MVERKQKILIVDDSSTALMAVQMLLRRAEYDVITARDGGEAVAKATRELPDLILMDAVMPQMTGIEACLALRAQVSTRLIPIILVTVRGEPDSVERGYASGCNDHLTKPINAIELATKVRDQLGEGGGS